ncbi:MAG: hypothetical protein ACSHXL_01435 [Bacteroidota bacterium]
MIKISEYLQFEFFSALGNFFTFVSTSDDNLKIVVDVFEMQDIDFDKYHTAGNLLKMDQVDVFYENEFIDVELE